jgi:hypothetical protein
VHITWRRPSRGTTAPNAFLQAAGYAAEAVQLSPTRDKRRPQAGVWES